MIRGQALPLCFRDACHKIIHATDLEFVEGLSRGRACITPHVILWGEHREDEWEARLDLIKYAQLACRLNS